MSQYFSSEKNTPEQEKCTANVLSSLLSQLQAMDHARDGTDQKGD